MESMAAFTFCEISLHYKTTKIPRKPTSDQTPVLPGLKQGFTRSKLLLCSDQTKKTVQGEGNRCLKALL
jgi:hypothetical protein